MEKYAERQQIGLVYCLFPNSLLFAKYYFPATLFSKVYQIPVNTFSESLHNFNGSAPGRYLRKLLGQLKQRTIEIPYQLCYIRDRKSTHSKVDAPEIRCYVLTDTAYPVGRQDRLFYFFLLSLSLVRKARNATISSVIFCHIFVTIRKTLISRNVIFLTLSNSCQYLF